MRIAILLSGLTRSFQETYKSFLEMINNKKVDIYIYTWSDFWISSNKNEIYDLLTEYYKPQKISIENTEDHDIEFKKMKSREEEIFSQLKISLPDNGVSLYSGLFSQYYTLNNCLKMVEKPENYDIIMRCRFDWIPLFKMNWINLNEDVKNNICCSNKKMPGLKDSIFRINDLFISSNHKNFNIYCNLYNTMMYENTYFDIIKEKKCLIPEFLLSYHLYENKINIKTIDWPYELRHRKEFLRNGKKYE